MKELTPDAKKAFFVLIHQILIVLDDWFCDTFGLSRKARGRYSPEVACENCRHEKLYIIDHKG
jgi:hypothetical protein